LTLTSRQDATQEFHEYHSSSVLSDLPSEYRLGPIDPSTALSLRQPKQSSRAQSTAETQQLPPLTAIISTPDFEQAAKLVLSNKSYIYASSSANTGLSLSNNLASWSRISFRPRVLRPVETVSLATSILGVPSQFPFYVSPMGTLGSLHKNAEPEMVRGCVRAGLHVVISTASTKPVEEIAAAYKEAQKELNYSSPSQLFFQLYVHSDDDKARTLLRKLKPLGFKGVFLTVDTPIIGKRTADRRLQAEEALVTLGPQETGQKHDPAEQTDKTNSFAPAFGGRPLPGQLTPNLDWNVTLQLIRSEWDGPIVLKGIQCAEDAKLALRYQCAGILLSNHGGRQLHSAPSALETLIEIREYAAEVLKSQMQIFLDGGLRDGADILKALALGATAVGVGRPFLYALAAYGSEGVGRCADSKCIHSLIKADFG
jgi:L-lactate dehydrogenase (cytochrome)